MDFLENSLPEQDNRKTTLLYKFDAKIFAVSAKIHSNLKIVHYLQISQRQK